uniref:Uncharacterized protein n=1 Tax=Candidatus Kentrum sp. TC TaxID=2126339 RepID=A0A450YP83_9GAMM|nr:MAG: hypothetical protein BECKTC1821E_GA0114239_102513 [Candidatus Kentron sp. TC]
MSKFDEFVDAFLEGVKVLAKDVFDGYEDVAVDDAKEFLEKSKEDMQRWTKLLALGALTEQDFSDLVQAKKALAEIHLLRQKGVALTKLERFRSGLINLVVDTAFDVFL